MPVKKSRINVYILLLAVIIAAVAAYYLPSRQPQNASMMSPRDYIKLVEERRAQRLAHEQEQRELQEQAEQAAESSPPAAPAAD